MAYALFFVAGSLVSGGAVFAASGTWVSALYQNASIYTNNAFNTSGSQLDYKGSSYIKTNAVMSALDNEGFTTSWNGQSLTIDNSSQTYIPSNNTQSSSSTVNSNASTYYNAASSNSVSLFDYPQFAEGTGDLPGTTTIYSSFVDNLGNRYLEPALSWNLSTTGSTASSTSSTSSTNAASTTNVTLGNTLGQPYGSQIINQHVNYQTFHQQAGTAGTFSKIYNLNDNYSYLTATLAPSAYYNNQPVNNDVGSLEIINEATGTDLYYYSNFSSNITSPVTFTVPLYYVNQIEVIFKTDGLGLINPQLIKY